MSLANVPTRQPVTITGIREGAMSCRLMEMGLISGVTVQVLGRAPLGDPLRLLVGDYELSLRSSDAELVDVAAA